ncbi:DUF1223 domain-containing protein [Mucilaginibacter xinganensis]|uniref:DUF1223 domain-containing protein n=1 Tax=Mucilaginibacter xinganensis TaxID=1234841 RepID=A0A223NRE6_9SPHI|nr:DUF1223 domain-containing protein [Mucilaginibacter xinganensis]ASU32228.1 hypothetical protein MuYL_0325 [Mucilaginibacter xinganensis]
MKPIKTFSLVAVLIAAALASTAFINFKPLKKAAAANKGFAVIELFTSEGCSSCPPADALVARIEKESKDKPVYILSFHVDYWNRLGWKDQFSSADFSKRQSEYSRYLNLQGVYTPQIVVNGKTEFVGSEEGTLRNAIRTNLEKLSSAQVELNISAIDQKQASLNYTVEGADKNTVLQVAVLEKAATSKVTRGENDGRTLSHVQIVRELQQVALAANNGTANIELPHGFDSKNWEVIGFLQNRTTGAITGAARASFSANAIASAAVKEMK